MCTPIPSSSCSRGACADTDDRLYEAVHDVAQWYVLHDRSARLSGVHVSARPAAVSNGWPACGQTPSRECLPSCSSASAHRADWLAALEQGRRSLSASARARRPSRHHRTRTRVDRAIRTRSDSPDGDAAWRPTTLRHCSQLGESAGRLAGDERSTPTEGDVERGLLLIRELIGRTESDEVRADLNACR
jgi:hypothetical protein